MRGQGADERSFHELARRAMRAIRLIGAVTPTNADAELQRLETGRPRHGHDVTVGFPKWTYARRDVTEIEDALAVLSRATRTWDEPLRSLYSARIEEMALETALVHAAGTPAFAALAAKRFPSPTPSPTPTPTPSPSPTPTPSPLLATDSEDPRSLLSQVRAALAAQRVHFSVDVVKNLGALAATGEKTVYVAAQRATTERAAQRIAIHEVRGHVVPRVRAERMHPIFALGTARGADDQEGLALFYEEESGLLDDDRKRELARRAHAATLMRAGADFVDVTRALLAMNTSSRDALATAARVFRGSNGRTNGLGRECVYLASFERVRGCIARDASAEKILASGQIAVDALTHVRHCAGKHASADPPPKTATV